MQLKSAIVIMLSSIDYILQPLGTRPPTLMMYLVPQRPLLHAHMGGHLLHLFLLLTGIK